MTTRRKRWLAVIAGATLTASVAGAAVAATDFGSARDRGLALASKKLFGVEKPVNASSPSSIDAATANADPTKLITLAKGLKARVVTTASGANTDMMALWPNDHAPTHLIVCNEQDTTDPGVQRIALADGAATTIVTGTDACDPIRRTAWGTIVFGEEAGNEGQLYELIDPLHTTGVSLDRTTGVFSGGTNPQNLVRRDVIGRLSFEGLGLLPNGVLYYGDELRPSNGTAGGSYYKFVPATPYAGGTPITQLSDSPLASGAVFALKLGRRSGNTDFGQGSNTGQGSWVPVCNSVTSVPSPCANLDNGAFAAANGLTGYYRPEDLEVDAAALQAGDVELCGNNTGNETFANFGETICITDGTVAESLANTAAPAVQFLVVGNPQFAMMDNLARQPRTGNWLINEDGDQLQGNNDIWDCLPDGVDDDLQSDGCVRVATLNDLEAETSGGIFSADGLKYFVSIQHNVTGKGVVLVVTGWRT
jgi:secreted PhoX family phosphatase